MLHNTSGKYFNAPQLFLTKYRVNSPQNIHGQELLKKMKQAHIIMLHIVNLIPCEGP